MTIIRWTFRLTWEIAGGMSLLPMCYRARRAGCGGTRVGWTEMRHHSERHYNGDGKREQRPAKFDRAQHA
jgi:hypothetical protein